MSEYKARQEAHLNWIKQSTLAYQLRNEMLHHLNYAYRNATDITQKVSTICEYGRYVFWKDKDQFANYTLS